MAQQQNVPQAGFNASTRGITNLLTSRTLTLGQNANVQLYPAGFAVGCLVMFSLTFTTTAFTGKTAALTTAPVLGLNSIVNNIQLTNNGGTTYWYTSGEGAYLLDRTFFQSLDPANQLTGAGGTDNATHTWSAPATLAASTTYTAYWYYWLPLAETARYTNGLQNLGNQTNVITLQLQVAQTLNGLYTMSDASAFSAIVASSSLSMTVEQDSTSIPNGLNLPQIGKSQIFVEQVVPVTSQQFIQNLTVGPEYIMGMMEFFSTTARYTQSNFSNLQVVYNIAQIPYTFTPQSLAIRNTQLLGVPLPNGTFLFPWRSTATGDVRIDAGRDTFPTASLNQFGFQINLASAPAAGDQCRYITQYLVDNGN